MGSATGDNQQFNRSDLHFVRRLMPGQNLWYARRAVNGLEDSVGDLFNLPGKSNADPRRAARAIKKAAPRAGGHESETRY
jgi:hypothetical protein